MESMARFSGTGCACIKPENVVSVSPAAAAAQPSSEIIMKIRKLLALSALALAAFAPLASHAQQAVRVGSKNFTEQFVLAEIYAQALEAAGIKTEKKLNLAAR
jgi:hypothetical protein